MPETASVTPQSDIKKNAPSEDGTKPGLQPSSTVTKPDALEVEASGLGQDEVKPDTVANANPKKPDIRSELLKKHKHKHKISRRQQKTPVKTKGGKRAKAAAATPESSTEESGSDTSSESDEPVDKVKKPRKHKSKRKAKVAEESDSSESDSDFSDSESERPRDKKRASKKSKVSDDEDADEETSEDDEDDVDVLRAEMKVLKLRMSKMQAKGKRRKSTTDDESPTKSTSPKSRKSRKKGKEAYQRVDQVWDKENHKKVLKPSIKDDDDDDGGHAFLVRRRFTWENEPLNVVIDIKSKVLRDLLRTVLKECKSVSLEVEEPELDPELLFQYLEDLRVHYRKTLKAQLKATKKRKAIKRLEAQRTLCKALVGYLDTDFADTKKSLYPLIQAGNITFDMAWGLFKPEDIVVTSCYGHWEEPRCLQLHRVEKNENMRRGKWYTITGRYLEYDGKTFGWAEAAVEIDAFKGPRQITTLDIYPLKYHKDPETIKSLIIERGRQFVMMDGMQYKAHKGLAFQKGKKGKVLKININGRIMIDPSTFRRICANYPFSMIQDEHDDQGGCYESEPSSCCSSEDEQSSDSDGGEDSEGEYKYKTMYYHTMDGEMRKGRYKVRINTPEDNAKVQRINQIAQDEQNTPKKGRFSDDELLLTTPVVLGFSFGDKEWLEFTISGVKDIVYNDAAFDSLMLPDKQKSIVRALVESHKYNGAKAIDDIIQGKGRGLVSVLHGPPGTGKTLTAEGISELLKCPLYAVSAGELGTDPAKLEMKLQQILDVAHSWGAVLLLDEADVFLEKREIHDITRNALVSIFLRLLEYFQGILFLTTNRVDTFDEAFQSRIHLPLRYAELTPKAKKAIWRWFFEAVRKTDSAAAIADFSDYDLDILARRQLNGRQIKNAVRTAQALALREGKMLDMSHLKHVLDVNEEFDRDLKGGTGYTDAMRSYM